MAIHIFQKLPVILDVLYNIFGENKIKFFA